MPTKENVADDATRGVSMEELCDGRWRHGPEFLKTSPDSWPVEEHTSGILASDEIKAAFVAAHTKPTTACLPEVARFSSGSKLLRATAWILRFVNNIIGRERKESTLKISEIREAEQLWWKQAQVESFPEEVIALKAGKPLPSSSRLLQLAPVLDDEGILRVTGRLERASTVNIHTRRPVLLDPKHPFTKLLVEQYHRWSLHQGQEMVGNELRLKYWILNVRAAVRQAWSECQECRNRRSVPQPPLMEALPDCRLNSFVRPFTVSGVDTAVHLELAASLSTDSCIMAVRRCISRRGYPKTLHSDNGTNFRGADRELRSALEEIDQDRMVTELSTKRIEWVFNPPAAPHMGGAWERLVGSVKKSMLAILKERAPKEEVLQTALLEAEAIVNSRPLTHVSLDHHDQEALTPSHFLIGQSSSAQVPGEFTSLDLCLRKQW